MSKPPPPPTSPEPGSPADSRPPKAVRQHSAHLYQPTSHASLRSSQSQQQQPQTRQPSGPSLTRIPSISSYTDREQPAEGGGISGVATGIAAPADPTLRTRKSISGQTDRARRFKYSTDDDVAEVEADFDRDYSEGYSYGLKEARRRAKEVSKRSPLIRPTSIKDLRNLRVPSRPIPEYTDDDEDAAATQDRGRTASTSGDVFIPDNKGKKASVSQRLVHQHSATGSIIHKIAECEEEHDVKHMGEFQEELRRELESADENEDDEDDENDEDTSSIKTNETFTLRERQDAINTTHPFGIRIWKPALYKKDRSVQRIAEGDIHSRPGKDVAWPVWIGNFLWSLTFGLLLSFACVVAAVPCFFVVWSSSSYLYGHTFLALARYLLFPFGKCVQLYKDENYMWEDEGEGRPYSEYQHWQRDDIERGRLFFGPTSSSVPVDPHGQSQESSHHQRTASDLTSSSASGSSPGLKRKRRLFGRGEWNIGRIIFFSWYYFLIMPLLQLTSLICWLGVFSLPMAKVTNTLSSHLRRHPLALKFRPASALKNLSTTEYSSSILICTYRAMGIRYYKYTVDGTNIFLINLMLPVLFVIFDNFVLTEYLELDYFFTRQYFVFFMALAAVIPLAYFIGQAVASISAQTSMGMGATINAFFSTIVEVFLYCVALNQGKGDLVEGSIVGSIFAGVLLLPGLSMCAGAIRRKTQRYNPKSAGVSSTMLLFAVIGALAPTIFYQIYGTYELRCSPCDSSSGGARVAEDCGRCFFYQVPLTDGPLYTEIIKPFSYMCATLLFIAYVIGLWFTLRTHAASIWQNPTVSELGHAYNIVVPPQLVTTAAAAAAGTFTSFSGTEEPNGFEPDKKFKKDKLTSVDPVPISLLPTPTPGAGAGPEVGEPAPGGHDAPNWSRTKSTVILLGATLLYAVIAEILVDNVDVVLEGTNISAKFLGVTVFALVPNTTEFLNAISFAMNGNVSLSMEIGSAYALQVCLLQIPALVFYSILWTGPDFSNIHDYMFTLIFPRWDLYMVIFCVFLFSYIYAEGKSNYFKGSILVLSYLVVMLGFYFSGNTAEAGIMSGGGGGGGDGGVNWSGGSMGMSSGSLGRTGGGAAQFVQQQHQ